MEELVPVRGEARGQAALLCRAAAVGRSCGPDRGSARGGRRASARCDDGGDVNGCGRARPCRSAVLASKGVLASALVLSLGPHASGQASCGPYTDPEEGASWIEVCVVDRPRYAGELFGAGADALELGYAHEADGDAPDARGFDNRPKVLLELPDRSSTTADVALGSSATVTFRLVGAVFAERVRSSDLEVRNLADAETARLRTGILAGGAAGDRAVEFAVEVVGAGFENTAERRVTLAFRMPAVTRAGEAMTAPSSPGVRIAVEVAPTSTGTRGFPDFPAQRQTLPGADAGVGRREDDGVRVLIRRPGPMDRALSVAAEEGAEGGTIDPEGRTLVFAEARDSVALTVARVALVLRDGLSQADGTPFSVDGDGRSTRDGDGAGTLEVSTAAAFGPADRVVFDRDGDGEAGTGEALSINDGVASGRFSLEEVVPGTFDVLYFPAPRAALRSGSVETVFSIRFARSGNRAPPPARESVRLEYLDSENAVQAFTIGPPSGRDRAHVRIRCASPVSCRVYLACDGADGADYFGGLDAPVDPYSVRTLTAAGVGSVIGAADADFTGGMRCEVFGGDIALQLLTRSGGVLSNTTYVAGGLRGEPR